MRIEDPQEAVGLKNKSIQEILQVAKDAGAQVTGARRLPSGDVRFNSRTENAKDALQQEEGWTKVIAASAKIRKQTYTVIAHGMRVRHIDAANQKRIIAEFKAANADHHQDLDIARIAWPRRTINADKLWSSLYIEVTSAETANRLITEVFLDENECKECERFCHDCQISQCFNCQQYGHIAARCSKATSCGHCAGWHRTNDCAVADQPQHHRCAGCGTEGHQAWAAGCAIRQEENKRTRAVFAARPRLFPVVHRAKSAASSKNTPPPESQKSNAEIPLNRFTARTLNAETTPEPNDATAQLFREIAVEKTNPETIHVP